VLRRFKAASILSPTTLLKAACKHHRSKHPKAQSKEAPSPRKQECNTSKSHPQYSILLRLKFSKTVLYSNHWQKPEFKSKKKKNLGTMCQLKETSGLNTVMIARSFAKIMSKS